MEGDVKFDAILDLLKIYGPLGIICCLALWFAWKKDQALQKYQLEQLKELRDQDERHKKEMLSLEERYISKAETWMNKHYELNEGLKAVVEGLKDLIERYLVGQTK